MRRRGVWWLTVVLLLGGITAARAADEDRTAPSSSGPAAQDAGGSWFSHWFGLPPTPKPPEPKPEDRPATRRKKDKDKDRDKDREPMAAAPEGAGSASRREQEALLRRMAVCDKLRVVAEETNDQELARMADQLDERALRVYQQRLAHLPAKPAALTPDEHFPEKHDFRDLGDAPRPPLPLHSVPGASAGREE